MCSFMTYIQHTYTCWACRVDVVASRVGHGLAPRKAPPVFTVGFTDFTTVRFPSQNQMTVRLNHRRDGRHGDAKEKERARDNDEE